MQKENKNVEESKLSDEFGYESSERREKGKSGNSKELSGPKKVAILLRTLGEEAASEILKMLSEEDVQRVTEEMLKMSIIPKKVAKEVLDEFINLSRQDVLTGSGYEFIYKILTTVFGPAKANAIMERLKIFVKASGGSDISMGLLHDLDAQSIVNFIRKEHPQTMAVILAYLDPKKALEVLQLLPKDIYADVLERIANLDKLAPGVVDEIGIVLDEEYRTIGGTKRVGGINALVEIIMNAPPGLEKELLERIEKQNPELAEEIRQRMFTFDDIVRIHDRYISIILREIDREVLLKALKGASEPVKRKILGAMSERARKVLQDELETMPPVRRIDVERAQQEILKVIRRLEQQGEIVVPHGKEDVI
ncbi:MAG: flagellar motor switch protein FliG [Candidatus Calescibacterium sp.]|jgi:flagellar motor switch protein FliG|nr:flagellar motor switch protein FliG [Candidatus Calescibacterium sp.]